MPRSAKKQTPSRKQDDESSMESSSQRSHSSRASRRRSNPSTPSRPDELSTPKKTLRSGKSKRKRSLEAVAEEHTPKKKIRQQPDEDSDSDERMEVEEDKKMLAKPPNGNMEDTSKSQAGGEKPADPVGPDPVGPDPVGAVPIGPDHVPLAAAAANAAPAAVVATAAAAAQPQQGLLWRFPRFQTQILVPKEKLPPRGVPVPTTATSVAAATPQREPIRDTSQPPPPEAEKPETAHVSENGVANEQQLSFVQRASVVLTDQWGATVVVLQEYAARISTFERLPAPPPARRIPQLQPAMKWVIVFLLLQVLAVFFGKRTDLLLSVDSWSDRLLDVYKHVLPQFMGGLPPDSDNTPEAIMHRAQLAAQIRQKRSALQYVQDGLRREFEHLETEVTALNDKMVQAQVTLKDASPLIEKALPLARSTDLSGLSYLRAALGSHSAHLIDVSFLDSWNIPEVIGCTGDGGESVSVDYVSGLVETLKEEAAASTENITADNDLRKVFQTWVADLIKENVPDYDRAAAIAVAEIAEPASGASMEEIQKIIRTWLDIDRADQTARIDYASLLNGASVIRSGDRATSPSMADNLPLFNRMAALLSLRFYGFGPEAALLPTYPPKALGQCFAFEQDPNSKYSSYAVLSIRLAKPIRIERVAIEHPSSEISDRSYSAIRWFRVIGFEKPNAEGRAWNLGSFEYVLQGSSLQDFNIPNQVGPERVPVFQSVSIAIDSTWSVDYSCLYRVRILGSEEIV